MSISEVEPTQERILKRIDSWGCMKNCGACCKLGPIESRPDLGEYLDSDELAEYKSEENLFDLIINDVPYIFGAEDYQSNDDRDLCKVKDLNAFNERMEACLKNMMRLIKTSNWKERVFHPIIMKVGSGRRNSNGTGLISMDVELEVIARKVGLTIHDRIHNELSSAFQFYNVARCIDNRYTIKSHETNLVMVKY